MNPVSFYYEAYYGGWLLFVKVRETSLEVDIGF